jgi:hypothetical protein
LATNFTKIGRNIGKQLSESIKKDYLRRFRKIANKGNRLVAVILELISKGISPVLSSRFLRYSESYRSAIMGKAFFFTRNGAVLSGEPGTKGLGLGKKQSPVNLKLSGDLHRSLNYNPSSGVVGFTDKKAEWHNKGMGVPERRLLPTETGEQFNRFVQKRLREALGEAVATEAKSVKGITAIRIKLK